MNDSTDVNFDSDQMTARQQSEQAVIQPANALRRRRRWVFRLLLLVLFVSLLANMAIFSSSLVFSGFYSGDSEPLERFHSGDKEVLSKIAVVEVSGTIMPPFTKRILRMIKRARSDDQVKGVVLAIDSPGGFVADSHQIFHRLSELSQEKPVYVSMKRMAASGGIYVAMGAGSAGKIYAEPTTWTGSIGVIIPRYDLTEFSEKVGVTVDSLKTGEFKDSLSPFRKLTDDERNVWQAIMQESFERFLHVIADNRRSLDYKTVKDELATGQIFTALQAKQNGLIDDIGYEDDVIKALKIKLQLKKVRVVNYQFPPNLLELVVGSVEAQRPGYQWRALLEATVPRAMYLCSWGPEIPSWSLSIDRK